MENTSQMNHKHIDHDKVAVAVEHDEHVEHVDNAVPNLDGGELPRGYYRSPRFIGTFIAVGMNLLASTGGFALIGPVLGQIDASIGPGPVIWLSLVYTMMLAIGLTLVGQLTDIFGRRWFFIGGTLLGAVGAVICSQGRTIPVLIGGQTLIGLSASTGYSYAFVIGELVPMKHRFMANSIIFVFSLPTAGFGSAISTAFILYTSEGWRWSYYLLLIANGLTALLYAVFYFPPSFHQKHGADTVIRWIKNYDYIGMFLYLAGLLLFIIGLSWGGSVYPWQSAAVIAPVIIGFCCMVALFVYEAKFKPAEPLVPIHLFKNKGWLASAILLALGASVYYSQAIIFPAMAATVYSNGRPMWAGLVGCVPGIGITVGEIIGGAAARKVGKTKFQVITAISIGTVLLGAMASCTPDTPNTAIALVMLATVAVGYNEAIALPICTICIRDQTEVGTAAGIAGSIRSAISTVASTIYSVVLATRETQTLSGQVPAALVAAGLPVSSVAEYMTAVAAGATSTMLQQIAGVTSDIIATGARAYQVAYSDAYRTIYYVSVGFGVLSILVACLVPNVDEFMTDEVATRLNERAAKPEEKRVEP